MSTRHPQLNLDKTRQAPIIPSLTMIPPLLPTTQYQRPGLQSVTDVGVPLCYRRRSGKIRRWINRRRDMYNVRDWKRPQEAANLRLLPLIYT